MFLQTESFNLFGNMAPFTSSFWFPRFLFLQVVKVNLHKKFLVGVGLPLFHQYLAFLESLVQRFYHPEQSMK